MSRLMQRFHIPSENAAQDNQDVYIVTLDNEVKIYLIGSQPDYLNIMSPFLTLPEIETTPPHILLSMLSMNMWRVRHPVFTPGLDIVRKNAVLSCRQPLAELSEAEAEKLVGSFINTVIHLKDWLQKELEKERTQIRRGNQHA